MRRPFVCLLLIAFAGCPGKRKPAPAQPAVPASFFAMTIPAGGADYPSVSVGGLGHPSTLAWGFIERNPGTYVFKGYDGYVTAAVTNGLVDASNTAQVTVTFGYTPAFYASDTSQCSLVGAVSVCPSPPKDITAWENFVTAVVSHYNGITMPHIRYYELWNEFSSPNFWTGSNQDMVALAQAAYPIVHSDPHSMLLAPSVSGPVGASGGLPDGLAFMTSYLQAGGNKYADGGSFHGYIAGYSGVGITIYPYPEQDSTSGCNYGGRCFGSIITKVTGFRKVFDQNGLAGKPMIDSEGSWGKNTNLGDPDQQAAWLARWMILQASYYPQITQAVWFGWNMDGGSLSATAATAFNQVFNWLVG